MDKTLTIAGKPLERFYKLPFEKGSRILKQQVLDAHTDFGADDKQYYLNGKDIISFKHGLVTMEVSQIDENWTIYKPIRIYFKVEYDHLLISCTLDTDNTYLSWDVYIALRLVMRNGAYDFNVYYWPACYDEITGRLKFIKIFNDRQGFDIELKDGFKGLFRPDDPFPLPDGRKVMERAPLRTTTHTLTLTSKGIGYCLAQTSLYHYGSQHYPFLIPYVFTVNANRKTVKSFEHFVLSEADTDEITLSPEQEALDEYSFEMKKIAPLHSWVGNYTPEKGQEAEEKNEANKSAIHVLWNRVLPLLVAQSFTHYWFSYGMRNVKNRPMKKLMESAAFSIEVPHLSFLLSDKGDYYELFLRFKIKGKRMQFSNDRQALPLVCSQSQPDLWYLLEAEMDVELVTFFGGFKYKIQVPKAYYAVHFERYVNRLERYYEVEFR
ncbi:hypothetical protein QWY86_10825 [Pedobacter aquatilis]|uniref:hypothetical protein n=1 Tax=Pedobacter aquatilis TaxID=351343 RepID=UPI0025B624F6|nr:hypothetical protein [Pedobacter aquatilis]MDN3587164.1 hypothetical protein [Pedobacter aquatilis]